MIGHALVNAGGRCHITQCHDTSEIIKLPSTTLLPEIQCDFLSHSLRTTKWMQFSEIPMLVIVERKPTTQIL